MVDPTRIEEKLRQLQGFQSILTRLAASSDEDLLGDPIRLGSVKYYLQASIECCLDMANHIIASEGLRPPKDYADTFSVLGEAGILPRDFSERLRSMAKFRNRLVHLYGDIDDRQVVGVLKNDLGDFIDFQEKVLGILE